jgi:hypothetical protein
VIPDHLRENREAHSPALSELVNKYRKTSILLVCKDACFLYL